MHGGPGGLVGGHGGLNGVKLEGPGGGYYCNSYTPPASNVVDHGLLAQAYSTFTFYLKLKCMIILSIITMMLEYGFFKHENFFHLLIKICSMPS